MNYESMRVPATMLRLAGMLARPGSSLCPSGTAFLKEPGTSPDDTACERTQLPEAFTSVPQGASSCSDLAPARKELPTDLKDWHEAAETAG